MDRDALLGNARNPEALEAAYREDAGGFAALFSACRDALPDNLLIRSWDARLAPVTRPGDRAGSVDLVVLVLFCLLAGTGLKTYLYFDLHKVDYFGAAVGFSPFLAMLLFRLHSKGWPKSGAVVGITLSLGAIIAADAVPGEWKDVESLAWLYLGPFLWGTYGLSRLNGLIRDVEGWARYIRFTGEFLVLSLLVTIGGGLVVLLVHEVLQLMGLPTKWAEDWVAVFGGAAIPLVCAWATDRFGALSKVMDVIARLFLPLVLPLVLLYLVASVLHLGELFTDRDMLFEFNVLLLCALAIAVFTRVRPGSAMLGRVVVAMLWLTVALSLVALCAAGWRVVEFGTTVNRLALLGNNLLLAVNLVLLCRAGVGGRGDDAVLVAQARFVPCYLAWAGVVGWLIPWVFRY